MTDIIDYNSDLEYLLKIHAEECESFSILHRYSFEKYSERSNYINIPVIILSSAIGFATGIDIGYDNMNIILGVSSIFVGIIKSIDTYFQLGKRSESHRICSLQFQQINKKIMIELSLKRDQRISAKDMLQIIKTDIKNLQDIAPLIDEAIVEMFKKNYGVMDISSNKIKFSAHTPNLCNGLSQVTINGEKSNDDNEGKGRRRRKRSSSRGSHGSRGSRGSSQDSYDDDEGGEDGYGNRGRYSGGSKDNNDRRGNDGNVSSGTASSGFMSSVSNLFHKGVNLIKGNTPPPEAESNNTNNHHHHNNDNHNNNHNDNNKKSNNSSRNSSRNHNIKGKNSVIELTSVVVDGAINNELQDIMKSKSPSRNSNNNAVTNNNENAGNLLLTESHLQQLLMLQKLQSLQQPQQQQPQQQQPQQQQPPPQPLRSPSSISHLSQHSHRSQHSQHSQPSFNPINFTNAVDTSSLVASADVVFTNTNTIQSINTHPSNVSTHNNNSQHVSRAPSVNGSTHNSVVGSVTPRVLNIIDDTVVNQVIEIHEIVESPPSTTTTTTTEQQPLNMNVNQNLIQPPEDDDGFM
jgi:hypothetical protein